MCHAHASASSSVLGGWEGPRPRSLAGPRDDMGSGKRVGVAGCDGMAIAGRPPLILRVPQHERPGPSNRGYAKVSRRERGLDGYIPQPYHSGPEIHRNPFIKPLDTACESDYILIVTCYCHIHIYL